MWGCAFEILFTWILNNNIEKGKIFSIVIHNLFLAVSLFEGFSLLSVGPLISAKNSVKFTQFVRLLIRSVLTEQLSHQFNQIVTIFLRLTRISLGGINSALSF